MKSDQDTLLMSRRADPVFYVKSSQPPRRKSPSAASPRMHLSASTDKHVKLSGGVKGRTHTPTFAELALESADSSSESADSKAETPVGMSSSADCL